MDRPLTKEQANNLAMLAKMLKYRHSFGDLFMLPATCRDITEGFWRKFMEGLDALTQRELTEAEIAGRGCRTRAGRGATADRSGEGEAMHRVAIQLDCGPTTCSRCAYVDWQRAFRSEMGAAIPESAHCSFAIHFPGQPSGDLELTEYGQDALRSTACLAAEEVCRG